MLRRKPSRRRSLATSTIENPMFDEIEQPGIGTYLMPGTPLNFSDAERRPVRRAPILGEHTDEILAEVLGLGETEIARVHDQGTVAGPSTVAAWAVGRRRNRSVSAAASPTSPALADRR